MGSLTYPRWSARVTRLVFVIAMLAAGIGIGAGALVVAQSDNDTFYGCLTNGGDLNKVTLNTAPTCSSDQTLVSWNEQGPEGTSISIADFYLVDSAESTVAPNAVGTATVDCGAGAVLIDAWLEFTGDDFDEMRRLDIPDRGTRTATLRAFNTSQDSDTIRGTGLCLPLPSE